MRCFFLTFTITILLLSCKSQNNNKEKNSYEVFSLLIDEFGKPTIPPRELYNLKPFSQKQEDSILNQIEKITIHPIFYQPNDKFAYNKGFDEEFNLLIKNLHGLKEKGKFDLSKININRPYELSIVDTLKMKKDRRYIEKGFDKLIRFSSISYNEELTKAVIIVGVNMGPLNGFSTLVFLEKTNGKWQIKGTDTFSIS